MARLPDRFDLWVRKARESTDAARQVDYVLGALVGLREWHFLNAGSQEKPRPAEVELDDAQHLLVFSDPGRIEELIPERTPLPVITIPTAPAMAWCLEQRATGCTGLVVNPGEDGVAIPMAQLQVFYEEWNRRGARQASGFWIPNLTNEEEDFWQENGL